jgi:hypothetical protein
MSAQEDKRKHLDFVQLTITRMAANSFLLKAWSVTLVAAIFALVAKDAKDNYILVAFIPVLLFWILDGYYLRQERLYRHLYDQVRLKSSKNIDFSLNAHGFTKDTASWLAVCFSKTLLLFYGVLLLLVILIIYGVS